MKYLIIFLLCVLTMQMAYSKKPDYQCWVSEYAETYGNSSCVQNRVCVNYYSLTKTTYDDKNNPSEEELYHEAFFTMKDCMNCVKKLRKNPSASCQTGRW